MTGIEDRVALGIQTLDDNPWFSPYGRHWRTELREDRLDMADPVQNVIGQQFRQTPGLEADDERAAVSQATGILLAQAAERTLFRLGLWEDPVSPWVEAEYAALTEEWKRQLWSEA